MLKQVEDADDYNCVAENAGGVSEKNVTITFDQPVILGDSQVWFIIIPFDQPVILGDSQVMIFFTDLLYYISSVRNLRNNI